MPDTSDTECARIRDLTAPYLPTNLAQKEARRDCPHSSLHHHETSYGQDVFNNVGVIYEICRAQEPCKFHGTPLPMQMSVKRRVELLSELECLEPPPYHDQSNIAYCRSIRDQIILTGDVTAASVPEVPTPPPRNGLSLLALRSHARSGPTTSLGSPCDSTSRSPQILSSRPRIPEPAAPTSGDTTSGSFPQASSFPSTARRGLESSLVSPSATPEISGDTTTARGGPKSGLVSPSDGSSRPRISEPATPETSGESTSNMADPTLPQREQYKVVVLAYLRDGEPPSTAKAVGYLTRCEQVEFELWQTAVAQAFGFSLETPSRPEFELYLPLGDQWTDCLIPMVLLREQPILIRAKAVRNMPGLDDLKPHLNPPFLPKGVCPVDSLPNHRISSPPHSKRCVSPPPTSASSAQGSHPADANDNTPVALTAVQQQSPLPLSQKRKYDEPIASSSRKKSSNRGTGVRAPTPDDVIIVSDSEDTRPAKVVQPSTSKKVKGKTGKEQAGGARDEIIDLTV